MLLYLIIHTISVSIITLIIVILIHTVWVIQTMLIQVLIHNYLYTLISDFMLIITPVFSDIYFIEYCGLIYDINMKSTFNHYSNKLYINLT